MMGAKTSETRCVQYELEIRINAPIERVWQAIIKETGAWWIADFHMVDPESEIEFDVTPGGRGLIEHKRDGSFLHWYSIQYYLPGQYQIYLVGNLAPDFGGPSTNNLKLSLHLEGKGCVMRVCDTHHGDVDINMVESMQGGWHRLFGDGLRAYCEEA